MYIGQRKSATMNENWPEANFNVPAKKKNMAWAHKK